MSANVGCMFSFWEVPWHGNAMMVDRPLTVTEAIQFGELDWNVGEVALQTAEDSPSPAPQRKALSSTLALIELSGSLGQGVDHELLCRDG